MTFQKGQGGRPKGAKNKLTNDVRQIFHEVYNAMGKGLVDEKTGEKIELSGHEAMLIWARANPTEFYRLYGKMIPTTQEVMTDAHEDFLDELVIEADITETPPLELCADMGNDKAIQPTNGESTQDNAPHPQDVNPNTPDIDANLV